MTLTIAASWLVACAEPRRRRWGFWTFLLSNVLWVMWALPAQAPALVLLQVCLAAMNIRGVRKSGHAKRTNPAE